MPTIIDLDAGDEPESFERAMPVNPRASRDDADEQQQAAEEGLIGSLFVDSAHVLARCDEAGLTPASIVDRRLSVVLDAAMRLRRKGEVFDQGVAVTALSGRPEFAGVNLGAYIVGLAKETATTAQAGTFIRVIRNAEMLADLQRLSLKIKDRAVGRADASEILTDLRETVQRAVESSTGGTPEVLMARAFDPSRVIPRPTPIYSIADIPVCTRGNLTAIYAQSKVGKSSFMGGMIAAAMTTPGTDIDTFGVTGPNYAQHALLHFDTEQSPYDWQQLVQSILRRSRLTTPPPWLMSFTIAGMEAQAAERFVQSALRLARRRFGGVHSVFIDGVADLVNDPNSPDECFPLIARLHGAAIEFDTAIVNILHLNPAGKDKVDKGRGHLGSQLERKAESNLTLKKDGDVTVVCAEGRQRGRPIPEAKSPAFKWSEEHGMHRSCKIDPSEPSGAAASSSKSGRKATHKFSDFKLCFPAHNEPGKPMAEIYRHSRQNVPMSQPQFYNLCVRFLDEQMIEAIEVGPRKFYRLAL